MHFLLWKSEWCYCRILWPLRSARILVGEQDLLCGGQLYLVSLLILFSADKGSQDGRVPSANPLTGCFGGVYRLVVDHFLTLVND